MQQLVPHLTRLLDVEKHLKGKTLTEKLIEDTANKVSESIHPITDVRGTAEYRRKASKGLAVEALTEAWREGGQQR